MAASRPPDAGRNGRGRTLGRILRTILWALVVAFVVGFVIGTLLRRELEKPVRYIGDRGGAAECEYEPSFTRHVDSNLQHTSRRSRPSTPRHSVAPSAAPPAFHAESNPPAPALDPTPYPLP